MHCRPTNVLPAVVYPTKCCVNHNFINNVVPHIHPAHTTTVNHINYQNQHYFPQTQSVVNEVTSQQFFNPPYPAAPGFGAPPRPGAVAGAATGPGFPPGPGMGPGMMGPGMMGPGMGPGMMGPGMGPGMMGPGAGPAPGAVAGAQAMPSAQMPPNWKR